MPFRRIVSVIHPDNDRSIKIATRCGARQGNKVMLMGQEFSDSKGRGTSHPFKGPFSALALSL